MIFIHIHLFSMVIHMTANFYCWHPSFRRPFVTYAHQPRPLTTQPILAHPRPCKVHQSHAPMSTVSVPFFIFCSLVLLPMSPIRARSDVCVHQTNSISASPMLSMSL